MIRTEIERNFLNLIKNSYKNPTAYIIVDERLNGNKSRMYTVSIAIQHSTRSSSQYNKARKGNKSQVDEGKENINLSLCQMT